MGGREVQCALHRAHLCTHNYVLWWLQKASVNNTSKIHNTERTVCSSCSVPGCTVFWTKERWKEHPSLSEQVTDADAHTLFCSFRCGSHFVLCQVCIAAMWCMLKILKMPTSPRKMATPAFWEPMWELYSKLWSLNQRVGWNVLFSLTAGMHITGSGPQWVLGSTQHLYVVGELCPSILCVTYAFHCTS